MNCSYATVYAIPRDCKSFQASFSGHFFYIYELLQTCPTPSFSLVHVDDVTSFSVSLTFSLKHCHLSLLFIYACHKKKNHFQKKIG